MSHPLVDIDMTFTMKSDCPLKFFFSWFFMDIKFYLHTYVCMYFCSNKNVKGSGQQQLYWKVVSLYTGIGQRPVIKLGRRNRVNEPGLEVWCIDNGSVNSDGEARLCSRNEIGRRRAPPAARRPALYPPHDHIEAAIHIYIPRPVTLVSKLRIKGFVSSHFILVSLIWTRGSRQASLKLRFHLMPWKFWKIVNKNYATLRWYYRTCKLYLAIRYKNVENK